MARTFPRVLWRIGLWVVGLSLWLAIDLVYEQTLMTWKRGPQMVGFTLMHGIGIFLLLALWGGLLWVTAVAIFAIRARSIGGLRMIGLLVAYAVAWTAVMTPYGFWQRTFIEKLAPGPHGVEFLELAAAEGDLETVRAFLGHGVAVNARDRSGATALHAAAVGGKLAVAKYLLEKGADVNAINRYGNSPLENALSMNRTEAARLLVEKGGSRIHGTEEQYKKAASEIVREQIQDQEMNDGRHK